MYEGSIRNYAEFQYPEKLVLHLCCDLNSIIAVALSRFLRHLLWLLRYDNGQVLGSLRMWLYCLYGFVYLKPQVQQLSI